MKNGFTLWFTGLSGSGKTTLSSIIENTLTQKELLCERLDGDTIRENLGGLGFSKRDRNENVKRIGFVCKLLSRNGVVAIAAAISPYQEMRQFNRNNIENYIEVFCDCDLETLIHRDTKGLYQKAIRGEIGNLTGVNDPFERPQNPEITINSANETVDESAKKILDYLTENGWI